ESVEQAVVSVQGRETEAGPRLVGYYVGEADAEELRRWAREKLPEHMVPWALMRMEQIPLLPNGKIDRRALPEASAEDAETRAPGAEEPALSITQESWLLREWAEGLYSVKGRVMNMHTAHRLRGPLDMAALERALNEIVRRHESLRSTFPKSKGLLSFDFLRP